MIDIFYIPVAGTHTADKKRTTPFLLCTIEIFPQASDFPAAYLGMGRAIHISNIR